MRIVSGHDTHISVPQMQIEMEADFFLPDKISCQICLGTNDDPDAPHLTVKLVFIGKEKESYTAVFLENPPMSPLEKVAVNGITLLGCAGADSEDGLYEIFNLLANRAYTPLAKLEITQRDHWLDIWLVIGEWEAQHQVEVAEFKEQLQI